MVTVYTRKLMGVYARHVCMHIVYGLFALPRVCMFTYMCNVYDLRFLSFTCIQNKFICMFVIIQNKLWLVQMSPSGEVEKVREKGKPLYRITPFTGKLPLQGNPLHRITPFTGKPPLQGNPLLRGNPLYRITPFTGKPPFKGNPLLRETPF